MEHAGDSATCHSGSDRVVGSYVCPDATEVLVDRSLRLLDFLPVAVVCLDSGGQAVLVNAGWTELTGRSAGREVGEGWLEVFLDPLQVQGWVTSVVADGRMASRDLWVNSEPGSRLMRFAATPRYDDKGRCHSYVLCGTDVTGLVARDDRLVYAVQHDALTGLLSRQEFLDQTRRWDFATTRAGKPSALLFLDVDNFKTINDGAGHCVGDEVLRVVGRRIKNELRPLTVLARYGGDEFAALLVDVTTPSDAAAIAGRILAGLSQPITVRGHHLDVSASIGVALAGDDHISGWLERADEALYEAKALGKQGFVVAEGSVHPEGSLPDGVATAVGRSVPSSTVPYSAATPFHAVHFYDDDDDLLPALTGYISAGLFEDSVVVIATAKHRRELRRRLDPNLLATARAGNRYIELDAAETLDRFMRNGYPDPDLFQMVVGSAIIRSATYQMPVRAYGEMVALLWAEGNAAAALRLEGLWTDLQHRITFPLLCAYPLRDFVDRPDNGYDDICNHHTQLLKAG